MWTRHKLSKSASEQWVLHLTPGHLVKMQVLVWVEAWDSAFQESPRRQSGHFHDPVLESKGGCSAWNDPEGCGRDLKGRVFGRTPNTAGTISDGTESAVLPLPTYPHSHPHSPASPPPPPQERGAASLGADRHAEVTCPQMWFGARPQEELWKWICSYAPCTEVVR